MCGAVVDLEEVLPVVLESLGDQVDQHFSCWAYTVTVWP
jgi:hypothetical protein